MLKLSATIRKTFGKKVKLLRQKGILPGVLYGPKIKNLSLEIDSKEFEKIYKEAGESSLISLEIKGKKGKNPVLIHEVRFNPLTDQPIHVDFFQPSLTEEIEAKVSLVFEGESLAVKDLGGTLIKNIHEVEVKALPQNLPHELKVNVGKLKTFEDNILIQDLIVPEGAKILKDPKEVVASVSPPEKVEEELEKPIEEKVEEVEKVGEEKEEEAPAAEEKREEVHKKKEESKK